MSGDAPAGELTREELLAAAEVLADMIDGEWGGPLSYSVQTWGRVTSPEQMDAIRKLEAYLAAKDRDGC
jgi:hypothetical protein